MSIPVPEAIHISGYRFIHIEDVPALQMRLKAFGDAHGLKGTILLSEEGINICVAAVPEAIQTFVDFVHADPRFSTIYFKQTSAPTAPYRRWLVKHKKEIITMKTEGLDPAAYTAPHLSAETLKQWLDDNRDCVLLDTRNTYEIEAGTFNNAVHLNIENFSEFPEAVKKMPEAWRGKPIVTYCTGGVRCEKAGAYLLQQGFSEVYQLDGGILQYFEECGRTHFQGQCFVFDERGVL
jgi:UPF0176 protein